MFAKTPFESLSLETISLKISNISHAIFFPGEYYSN